MRRRIKRTWGRRRPHYSVRPRLFFGRPQLRLDTFPPPGYQHPPPARSFGYPGPGTDPCERRIALLRSRARFVAARPARHRAGSSWRRSWPGPSSPLAGLGQGPGNALPSPPPSCPARRGLAPPGSAAHAAAADGRPEVGAADRQRHHHPRQHPRQQRDHQEPDEDARRQGVRRVRPPGGHPRALRDAAVRQRLRRQVRRRPRPDQGRRLHQRLPLDDRQDHLPRGRQAQRQRPRRGRRHPQGHAVQPHRQPGRLPEHRPPLPGGGPAPGALRPPQGRRRRATPR